MRSNRMIRQATALAIATALFSTATLAVAQEEVRPPRTSDFVNDVTVELTPSHGADIGRSTVYAGIAQCNSLINNNPHFSVDFRTTTTVDMTQDLNYDGVHFYRLERDENVRPVCPADDPCNEVRSDDITRQTNRVEVSLPFRELSGHSNAAICDEGEIDEVYYVQLRLTNRSTVPGAEWTYEEARVVFDLVRPDAPTLTDVFATEFSISVEFDPSESGDVERHSVVYGSQPFEGGVLPADATTRTPRPIEGADATSGRVSVELDGGESLWVAVAARDRAGNYSLVSDPMEVTVAQTRNFWDYYVEAGGAEEGGYGCQSAVVTSPAHTLFWWLLALAIGAVAWRVRRRDQQVQGAAIEVSR